MRNDTKRYSFSSYLLSLPLVVLLTVSAFHVLEIDTDAYACSCALPESAKNALDNSDVVFSGTVVDIGGKHPDYTTVSRHDPVSVTFAVDRVWKGPANSTMIVSTESSEASCGYEFQQNEKYMVYSYEKEKGDHSTLHTGFCSGTSLLSDSYGDMGELGTGTKISQLENEIGKSQEENKIESIALTLFDLYFEEEDFTEQGPNHNILMLNKEEFAVINIYIKNNDDKPHQITLKDPRGPNLGLFETFRFEPEQITVMPRQTNSTQLHLAVSEDTNTHSSFVTFLGQSSTFGMKGLGFFVVVDREIDDYIDKSLRRGLPGGAFQHLNTEISESEAEKLIGSNFGIPEYIPSGYEFRGMDGSEDQQRFVYSPANIDTETTVFSEFWNDGGLLVIYSVDGPNVNNTKSLPIKIAQDEAQQIMINGMMGDATEKQTRVVVESDITYDVPASVSFFDDVKKKSAHLRANMQLDELLNIASSIPIYDEPNFPALKNMPNQNHSIILPFDAKEKTLDEFMKWCKPHYEKEKCEELYPKNPISVLLSPLKQMQSGISFEEVKCRESLVLVQKHNGSPACVTPETKQKLIERDWSGKKITNHESRPS